MRRGQRGVTKITLFVPGGKINAQELLQVLKGFKGV